jgi:GNAT superfamily N-acetyltransferase
VAALTLDSSLTVTSPEIADWGNFFFLAQAENWVVLPPEVALFRGPLAAWAFGLRRRGEPCGFATAVPYRTFAWLGNLILSPDLRGHGFGALLFDHVCDRLRRSGTREIWLTASEQGRLLYQRRGFCEVDRIERWLLEVPNRRRRKSAADGDLESLCRADEQAWGSDRRLVLHYLATGGELLASGRSVALLQHHGTLRILGPWLCPEDRPGDLAGLALAAAGAVTGGTLYADILASSGAGPMLKACGFRCAGLTSLMAWGRATAAPKPVIALASLGSLG